MVFKKLEILACTTFTLLLFVTGCKVQTKSDDSKLLPNKKIEKSTTITSLPVEKPDSAVVIYNPPKSAIFSTEKMILGAERFYDYQEKTFNKRIGITTNQSGLLREVKTKTSTGKEYLHLVDFLKNNKNLKLTTIFSPEHGFRGNADAGEKVKNGIDPKTKLPVISLYGNNKKPKASQLKNIDLMIFDLQDVGARFYTYISTLHYVMEACAEQNIPIIVLDRPNPNGHIVDGPVLEKAYTSFVGMHQIPVLHGMTIGEYAQMINGEGWLKNGVKANLSIVRMAYYSHEMSYDLPVRPSPNLPNRASINLYPSLCFFEGTKVSVGRGTDFPFQVYGSPNLNNTDFSFVPKPNFGSKNPKHKNTKVYGKDLRAVGENKLDRLNLSWIINAYQNSNNKKDFFNTNNFFDKLAGTNKLKKQIIAGMSEEDIRATWQNDLSNFKEIRSKYLIYK